MANAFWTEELGDAMYDALRSLPSMRKSPLGELLSIPFLPNFLRYRLVVQIAKHEGGDMTSMSLREFLRSSQDVNVGSFSYGSLLIPGFSDRQTTIGRYVSIGPNVRRFGAAHPLDRLSMHPFFYNPSLGFASPDNDVRRSAIEIESECWIGANVVILPGCERIGLGAVVGAGAVVTKNIPDFAVVVGNPARIKRFRFEEADRIRLRESKYWELEPADLLEFHASWATKPRY